LSLKIFLRERKPKRSLTEEMRNVKVEGQERGLDRRRLIENEAEKRV